MFPTDWGAIRNTLSGVTLIAYLVHTLTQKQIDCFWYDWTYQICMLESGVNIIYSLQTFIVRFPRSKHSLKKKETPKNNNINSCENLRSISTFFCLVYIWIINLTIYVLYYNILFNNYIILIANMNFITTRSLLQHINLQYC